MERRLAAILAADVAGYSNLVERNEEATTATLRSYVAILNEAIAKHHGHIFNTAGDSVAAEFPSIVEALLCAVQIQRTIGEHNAAVPADQRMRFRIGVNLGDVIAEADNYYGMGVNVAARLEELADPGGICVSGPVYDQVRRIVEVSFENLGSRRLKNISEPVRVYRVLPAPRSWIRRQLHKNARAGIAVLALLSILAGAAYLHQPAALWAALLGSPGELVVPNRTSIAVLPFQNLSGDEEQDYFSDGLTTDLTTDLARFKNLFVIASNSSFQYKGSDAKFADISHELRARYLVEGSVQRIDDRLRISTQLIDGATGEHVWAERYDRRASDLFSVQDDILQRIVGALAVKVSALEEKRAMSKETTNLQAYDYYLQGTTLAESYTKEDADAALRKFTIALELDPEFSRALNWIAYIHLMNFQEAWSENPEQELELALDLAKKALDMDGEDYYHYWTYAAVSYAVAGAQLAAGNRERSDQLTAQAMNAYDRALQLNPNDADLLAEHADLLAYQGKAKAEEAIEQIHRAMQMNPIYPEWYLWSLGAAYFHATQYDEAVVTLNSIKDPQPRVHLNLAASYARLSEQTKSADERDRLLQQAHLQLEAFQKITPGWTLAREQKERFATASDQEHWIAALKIAGAK
jgi:TolB-like protein/class 3 adenylate cyclase